MFPSFALKVFLPIKKMVILLRGMQDLSTAGDQLGLDGCRSSLVSEPFRVYDELHQPLETQFRSTGPA